MDFVSEHDKDHRQVMILDDIDLTAPGCVTLGVISDIDYIAETVSLFVDAETVEDVPVFYHCQRSSKVSGGILAFSTGDEVLVGKYFTGEDEDRVTNYIVFGFSSNEPNLCRSLVAAVGDDDTDLGTIGHSIYRENEGGDPACTSISSWDVRGNLSFTQVRFMSQEFAYARNDTDDSGQPIAVSESTDIISSVGIAHGVVIDPGPSPDTVNITLLLTTLNLRRWEYCRQAVNKTRACLSNEFTGHANLSEDGTRVYFAYAGCDDIGLPVGFPLHTHSSSITCETYSYSIDPDSLEGAWVLDSTETYSFPGWSVSRLFVGRDGTVQGLWRVEDISNAAQFSFSTFNFFTGERSGTDTGCVGQTVRNGEFAWYNYNRDDQPAGYSDYYEDNFGDPSATSTTYEYCDEGCYQECANHQDCGTWRTAHETNTYWCEGGYTSHLIDQSEMTVGINGTMLLGAASVLDSVDFSRSYDGGTFYSAQYQCNGSCPAGDWECYEISGYWSMSFGYSEQEHGDSITTQFNCMGVVHDRVSTSKSRYTSEDLEAVDLCETTYWSPWNYECGCKFTPAGLYTSFVKNPIYYPCTQGMLNPDSFLCSDPTVSCSDSTTKTSEVLHPITINDAYGRQAFVIYDQNSEIEFKGVLWNEVDSELVNGDLHWTVQKNGEEKTQEIFDCTGFSLSGEHPFHHMVFLW